MSAPYKIREFKASSGNCARIKIFPVQPNCTMPVDVTWDDDASEADISECNEWFLLNHPECPFLYSAYVQDEDLRQNLLRSQLSGSN